ncbi:MAG TPA: glycosyltransferase family 4 protein, partial [Armatimonadota bacterium]
AETYLVTITKQLQAQGDEVLVFCPAGRPFAAHLLDRGITPISWKTSGKLNPRTLLGLINIIKTQHIDIVHTHLTTGTFLGSVAAKFVNIPSVATVHGFYGAYWYRYPDRVIAVSEAVKRHLITSGVEEEKIRVVHNGVEIERYHPLPTSEAKQACGFDQGLRIGMFARFSPEKGFDIALEAWASLRQDFPGAKLMLVGDGKCRRDILNLIARLQLQDSVELTGFVSDPRALISACNVVLTPSLQEGLGLAALEAMALERPVIASDAGGLPEAVIGGETGLVVPRGDARALAAALRTLLTSPAQVEEFGKAGRRRVSERFDASRQVLLLRDVLTAMPQGEYSVANS